MKEHLAAVCWRRLSLAAAVGLVLVLMGTTAYDSWRMRNGWCVRFAPDGSEKMLYGAECSVTK